MVPILDLHVGVVDGQLTWQFYRKEVANILVLMERSAMSALQKRLSLKQEVVRIIRNTKCDLPDRIKKATVVKQGAEQKQISLSFRLEGVEENEMNAKCKQQHSLSAGANT